VLTGDAGEGRAVLVGVDLEGLLALGDPQGALGLGDEGLDVDGEGLADPGAGAA